MPLEPPALYFPQDFSPRTDIHTELLCPDLFFPGLSAEIRNFCAGRRLK